MVLTDIVRTSLCRLRNCTRAAVGSEKGDAWRRRIWHGTARFFTIRLSIRRSTSVARNGRGDVRNLDLDVAH